MTVSDRVRQRPGAVAALLSIAFDQGMKPRHPTLWNDFNNIGRPPGGPWNNWNQWSQFQNRIP